MPPRPKADQVTAEHIRQRLAGTQMPEDPLAVIMPPGSGAWPEDLRRKMCENLKPAGILIPIIERADSLSVLLTQRSADLANHAGQISFPGGRMESADADITRTALRETHEEVGIRPDQVDVAGYLPPMLTVTGYAVTPIVGLVQAGFTLTLDENEVEFAFEVPLPFLLDSKNQQSCHRELRGVIVPIVEFNYGSRRIWGATANILVEFRKIIIKNKIL
jgi:8-oxo-dGTP pyrophosphatase MutT (NUDIX family)